MAFAADKPASVRTPATAVGPAQTARPIAVPQAWIAAEASKLAKSNTASVDAVVATARQKLASNGAAASNPDVEALALQVLQKANDEAASDLKALQAQMKANADKRKALRDAQQKMKEEKDSLSEMGSADQLRLQQLMDRKSKLEEMISNLLKKSSDTQAAVTGNLK